MRRSKREEGRDNREEGKINFFISYFLPLPSKQAQRGNVFIFILLGIVLFAALSYTVARSFQSDTTSQLSKREAELAATEILDNTQRIKRGVDRLRRQGCSENQITFQYDSDQDGDYNDTDEAYYNSRSPTDHSCHVFHPSGGKISWPSDPFEGGSWIITGDNAVASVGTDDASPHPASTKDIVALMPSLPDEICSAINKTLGIDTTPIDAGLTSSRYTGTFSTGGNRFGDDVNSLVLDGEEYGCLITTVSSPGQYFYGVVFAR